MNMSSDAEILLVQLEGALEAAPQERRHFGAPILSGHVVIIHKGLPGGSVMPSGSAFDELLQAGLLAKVEPLDQRDQRYEITSAGHHHVRPTSWRGRSWRITDLIRSASRSVLGVVIAVASTVIGGLVLLWLTRAWQ